MSETFTIVSYNLRGYNQSKTAFLHTLIHNHDIVCVQEHWLLGSQFAGFLSDLDCQGYCLSSMKDNEFLWGRPHGGVAILWKRELFLTLSPVPSICDETAVVQFSVHDVSFGIFNLYMPCDGSNPDKFNEMLLDVKNICTLKGIDHIIMCGDFNTDLSRLNSRQTSVLKNHVRDEGLSFSLHHTSARVDYTYESSSCGSRSILDHFVLSTNLFNDIIEYSVSHPIDNFSDHSPLELKLNFHIEYLKPYVIKPTVRFKWDGASPDQLNNYKASLDNFLSLNSCDNDDVDACYAAIVKSCVSATEMSIPIRRFSKKRVYKWSANVKVIRQKAMFWHKLWIDNDRPKSGIVFDIRKKTRRDYHEAVKLVLREQKIFEAGKIVESLQQNNSSSYWHRIKKLNKTNQSSSKIIDGKTLPNDIAEIFTIGYEGLYSSVGYSSDWENQFCAKLEEGIENECASNCEFQHVITESDISSQLLKLAVGKGDVYPGLSSDCFIHGSHMLRCRIAQLFNCMLKTGSVPSAMGLSHIVPLPKDRRKSLRDSSNYRSIAINGVISKLLDHIILSKSMKCFETSELQFGFKKNSSTTQCTFILQEIVSSYISKNNKVYVMLLDCSKAFDRVSYEKLFELLLDRQMCPHMLKMVWNLYKKNSLCVKWEDTFGRLFEMSNGVKQGGVLSPKLFTLYIDGLFDKLKSSGFGCFLNGLYYGALGYADDIALIAASKSDLENMLKICTEFAETNHLLFNPSKSVFMIFGREIYSETVLFNSVRLTSVQSSKHLGHIIETPNCSVNPENILSGYIAKVNSMAYTFANLPFDVKYSLCKTFGYSMYGCELWKLSQKCLDKFNVLWRKGVRKLLSLPYQSHSVFLPLILDDLGLENVIVTRSLTFMQNCLISRNVSLKNATFAAVTCVSSDFGEKCLFICGKINCDFSILHKISKSDVKLALIRNFIDLLIRKENHAQLVAKAQFIVEILIERDYSHNVFNYRDCTDILDYLCVE